MNDNYQSDFKDTDAVRKYASRYNIYSLLFALGIFIIIASIIIALVGLVIAIVSDIGKSKLKEKQINKYTVAAVEFIDFEHRSRKKIFRKDVVISILLIILVPFIYYLIHTQVNLVPASSKKYFNSVLILILAIAVFIILYSKGKKEAYSNLI